MSQSPLYSLQRDLKNVIYKYNGFMLVSHLSKYIPEKITNVKLDSNNNVIPPGGAKLIDFDTAKSPYQKGF